MENSDLKKYATYGIGALLAGGLIYYLARDPYPLDSKLHTKENMLPILDELKLEYLCVYIRNYNRVLQAQKDQAMKGAGKDLDEKQKMMLKRSVIGERFEKLKALCKRHEKTINHFEILNKWMD